MRARLAVLPTWLLIALNTVLYATTLFALTTDLRQADFPRSLIAVVVAAGAFGLIVGIASHRRRQSPRALVAGMTRAQKRTVLAAAAGGPVPDDPALREAAAALVQDRIGELDRGRGLTFAVFAGAAAVSLVAAIANPWYLVVTAAGVAAVVDTWREPARLRAWLAALDAPVALPGRPQQPKRA
jgi:hypothetical protein